MATWSFKRLTAPSAVQVDRVLAIYRGVIEPSEQKNEAAMRAQLAHPEYLWLAAIRDGEIGGFATVFAPEGEDFCLLEYLAVDARLQGRGLGSVLFTQVRKVAGTERVLVLEVDADVPGSGVRMRRRRLGFYARLGCRRLGSIPYELPLDERGKPPPMWLLAHAPPDAASLPASKVRRWLRMIYVGAYQQRAGDPRIADMMQRQTRAVPLVSIGS
jgi:GNAT superfamily N-acetyltransferase